MWFNTFEDRLSDWNNLRKHCQFLSLEDSLLHINTWWFQAPIVTRRINWDEFPSWPGPWDLLANDNCCDLARALGIVYTIMMLDLPELETTSIAQTDQGNLVLEEHGKYILNWGPRELLNIQSVNITIHRQLMGEQLQRQLG